MSASRSRRVRLVGLLVALPVLGLLVALVVGLVQPVVYRATARVFVASASIVAVSDVGEVPPFVEQSRSAYADVATTPLVLNDVISALHLGISASAFAERLQVTVPQDTSTIEISATARSAGEAAREADAVAAALPRAAAELTPSGEDAPKTHLTVLGTAVVPTSPDRSLLLRDLLIGGGSGLVAALLVLALVALRRPPTGDVGLTAPSML